MKTLHPPGFEFEKKNLAIDFDGVVHGYDDGWKDGTCYGEPVVGAVEAIKFLALKYRLILFSCRARTDRPLVNEKTGMVLIYEWLVKHGIYDCFAEITSEKPRAMLYVDDNAYRFENWKDTLNYIKENEWN